jgi:hypothetical protein
MRWATTLLMFVALAAPAAAQESQLHADFRREAGNVAESCGAFAVTALAGCAMEVVTDEPVHVALGNLPPQNGFGFGVAFVEHYTPNENWRLGWNADAVGTFGGSWRAGLYMKIVRTKRPPIQVITDPDAAPPEDEGPREFPVVNLFVQTISLEKVFFFGLGPSTVDTGRSLFSERQTIVGANTIWPVSGPAWLRALKPSLLGGVNGRFVSVQGNGAGSDPAIGQLYDNTTAPGLDRQPAFLQFDEGVRFKPSWFGGRVRPNYELRLAQFLADADAHSSFHRWSIDLKHELPIYRNTPPASSTDANGPDECGRAPGGRCPAISRNREGAIGLRVLLSSSAASSGSAVPFYFQPTLGGSDLNGDKLLGSYQDYRFRGPHVFALQESIEHSIWGPIGAWFMADQGKVALTASDLGFDGLVHSFAAGVTLRAGGFPVLNLSFAWGGSEGHHILAAMDGSLLGGSARPPLF